MSTLWPIMVASVLMVACIGTWVGLQLSIARRLAMRLGGPLARSNRLSLAAATVGALVPFLGMVVGLVLSFGAVAEADAASRQSLLAQGIDVVTWFGGPLAVVGTVQGVIAVAVFARSRRRIAEAG